MKVPLKWVWENDPEGLPDDDHARCIAAPDQRFLACGGQLFALTTRLCTFPASGSGRSPGSFSTLQMEYLGLDWARGLAQRFWGGDSFDGESPGGEAQQAAGLALLAAVAGALAAGSAVRSRPPSSSQIGVDDLRQPQRPPGWPPRRHAPRPPRPALLPFRVGGGDHR